MPALAAVDFTGGVERAWASVAAFVPKLIGFLVIVLIGYLVAKLLAKVLDKILERVGFDRLVERGGVRRALERTRYDASDILAQIVFYAVMLFVLQMAFGIFGPNPVSDLIHSVIAFLPRIFVAILIVIIAAAIAAAVRELLRVSLGTLSYGNMLATAASVAIIAIGIFAALNQLEIAPAIVNGLFYALLAIVVGSAIVAIGGAGIVPLRRKWEEALARWDAEAPRLRRETQGATERARLRTEELREQARDEIAPSRETPPGVSTYEPPR